MEDRSYLLLKQNLLSHYQGLVMVYSDDNGRLTWANLRVYEKFNYLLQQVQQTNNKFIIMPYLYKREMGLVLNKA